MKKTNEAHASLQWVASLDTWGWFTSERGIGKGISYDQLKEAN